jgi:predicted aspartyl protease
MRRRDALIRLGLAAAALGGAWWFRDHVIWAGPAVEAGPDGSSGWLPFARERTVVPTVAVRIGGREVTALVDSGAQYSVMDRGLFRELGLTEAFQMPLVAYGVGGGAQVGRGTRVDVTVGALGLRDLRAAVLDLGPLASAEGIATPLILGRDLLRSVVLDLDLSDRRLRLTAPDRHRPEADLRPVAVRMAAGALAAEITVEGAVLEAVVDTGASALLSLSREAANAAGLLDGRERRAGSSLVLGGAVRAEVAVARTVTFADQLYRRTPVSIFADGALPGVPDALLGMEAFQGRRAALDIGGGRLLLSRGIDVRVGR